MTRTLGQIIRDSFSGYYQRSVTHAIRPVCHNGIAYCGQYIRPRSGGFTASQPDTLVMTAMLAVVCGAFIYDIIKRRVIDDLSERYKTLEHSHNKIVHEVARHRYGVNVLKDGLNAVIEISWYPPQQNQRILAVKNSPASMQTKTTCPHSMAVIS